MSHQIAIVEDDPLISGMVLWNLQQQGYGARVYDRAEAFLQSVARNPVDLLILGVNLPGIDGLQAVQRIRQRGGLFPILMLTVRGETASKVAALGRGADDYLTKPFDMAELQARVQALLRRSLHTRRPAPADGMLTINRRRIDLATRTCQGRGIDAVLSAKEIALLLLFYHHAGTTLSRAEILERVWGMEVDPTPRTVDNFLMKLRRTFEDDPENPRHFLTIRGHGYRFEL